MNVYFYFDPSCPWCWVTSRWLNEVAVIRGVTVSWLPFSLALKNNEIIANDNEKSPYGEYHRSAHRTLRLIEAAAQSYGAEARFKLYSALGAEYHVHSEDELYTDQIIKNALKVCSYDIDLDALDDIAYDRDLQKHLDSALEVVGTDVGVPTIIFETEKGKTGYFGPVITRLPDTETGLRMWDGLSALAEVDGFYELKRSRIEDVDTLSTKRII